MTKQIEPATAIPANASLGAGAGALEVTDEMVAAAVGVLSDHADEDGAIRPLRPKALCRELLQSALLKQEPGANAKRISGKGRAQVGKAKS